MGVLLYGVSDKHIYFTLYQLGGKVLVKQLYFLFKKNFKGKVVSYIVGSCYSSCAKFQVMRAPVLGVSSLPRLGASDIVLKGVLNRAEIFGNIDYVEKTLG